MLSKLPVKKLFFALVLPVVMAGIGGYLGYQQFTKKPANLPHLNQIALADVHQQLRHGGEWLGFVVVVNHWATWCAPCREEIPLLIEYQSRMESQGVQVIGIAHDLLDAARRFGDEIGIDYPSLVAIVDGNKLLKAHGNTSGALPYTVVFDRQGNLVGRKLGVISLQELNAMVNPLL